MSEKMICNSNSDSLYSYPIEIEHDVISLAESIQKSSLDTVIRRDKWRSLSLKVKSPNRNSRLSVASEISEPIDVQRQIHVYHNPDTGALEGLPLSWIRAINTKSQDEEAIKCLYQVHPIDKSFHERLRRKNEHLKKNSVSTYQRIKAWFGRKPHPEILSFPTDFHHTVHVRKNSKTGELEGLPQEWLQTLAE